jgi:hypothetical protein
VATGTHRRVIQTRSGVSARVAALNQPWPLRGFLGLYGPAASALPALPGRATPATTATTSAAQSAGRPRPASAGWTPCNEHVAGVVTDEYPPVRRRRFDRFPGHDCSKMGRVGGRAQRFGQEAGVGLGSSCPDVDRSNFTEPQRQLSGQSKRGNNLTRPAHRGFGAIRVSTSELPQLAHFTGQRRRMKYQSRPICSASFSKSMSADRKQDGQYINAIIWWSMSLPMVSIVAGYVGSGIPSYSPKRKARPSHGRSQP